MMPDTPSPDALIYGIMKLQEKIKRERFQSKMIELGLPTVELKASGT